MTAPGPSPQAAQHGKSADEFPGGLLPDNQENRIDDWRSSVPLPDAADDPEVQAAVIPDPEAPDEDGEFTDE